MSDSLILKTEVGLEGKQEAKDASERQDSVDEIQPSQTDSTALVVVDPVISKETDEDKTQETARKDEDVTLQSQSARSVSKSQAVSQEHQVFGDTNRDTIMTSEVAYGMTKTLNKSLSMQQKEMFASGMKKQGPGGFSQSNLNTSGTHTTSNFLDPNQHALSRE